MNFRLVVRLALAPLLVGLAGFAMVFISADIASGCGFAAGAGLVAIAVLASGGFFVRVPARTASQAVFRLAASSVIKWVVSIGGASWALQGSGTGPLAFTSGVIAGLLSTLFSGAHRGPRHPGLKTVKTVKDVSST